MVRTVLKAQGNTPTRGRVAGGGSTAAAKSAAKTASGTVKSVAANMLTLTISGAGGKDMMFIVNGATKVSGMGVTRESLHPGDHVTVSYTGEGSTMLAASVRITAKGTK